MSTAKLHPIKAARLKKGLTQQAVADSVGVSKAAVSRWESGIDQPAPATALILVRALPGLSLEKIYSYQRPAAEQGREAA